ncbi:MAG TPA: helix-turn-helix transcriptional regulator [Caulobacteraceae bacterium]|jgi:transcriptional regulator with XRE-family HTH domain
MSDEIDFHIGKRMRRRRRLLGLTQQQLADACGVRFQQIQKYECGANRVSAARLWRIAGALETPVSYFYEGLAASAPAQATVKLEPTMNVLRASLGDRARRPLMDVTRVLTRDNDAA